MTDWCDIEMIEHTITTLEKEWLDVGISSTLIMLLERLRIHLGRDPKTGD